MKEEFGTFARFLWRYFVEYFELSDLSNCRFLEIARSEKPDLIALDLQMPNKGGEQVYEEMRRDSELMDIPVCIFTGEKYCPCIAGRADVPWSVF